MEAYLRQQFDFLLITATERFVERVVQRSGGPEAALNRFDQFTTTIDGQTLHFVHARSQQPDALPRAAPSRSAAAGSY